MQQQNIIRQGMQEQLSFEPQSLTPEAPSIWLHDAEGNFQELSDLLPETVVTPLSSPASDSQHLFSQSDGESTDSDVATTNHLNQLDRDDCQQVPSSETQINNSVYSSLILEKPAEGDENSLSCGADHHIPPDQAVVRRLSQEVELLTSQNEALNQRNQEMLNQLTEADREIERLKAELSSRYTEPHHLPEVEQLGQTGVEDLERELSLRNQQLLEAQKMITSLEENLRETEALLQLNETKEETGQEKRAEKAEGYLLQCLEAAEAKVTELERQFNQSEVTCRELQMQNTELKEAEKLYRQTAAEAEADVQRLNQELEKERLKDGDGNRCVSGEERMQEVIEGMVMRLNALGKLLEAIDTLDVGLRGEENKPTVRRQLKWEEEFWSSLLNKLNPSQLNEEKPLEELLSEVTERMMVEKQMLLLGVGLLSESDSSTDEGREGLKDLDINWNIASVTATETIQTGESRIFDFDNQPCEIKHFRVITQMKISLLNQLASSVGSSAHDKLQLMAHKLSDLHFSEHPWSGFIHSAATEALYCCRLTQLQSKYERQLEETKQKLLTSSLICSNCVDLMEENRKLKERLSNLEEQQSSSLVCKMNACCQTEETYPQDTDVGLQVADESVQPETPEDEMFESLELDSMEIPPPCFEGQLGIQQIADENTEKSEASHKETDPSLETEQVLVQRRRVEELEELLAVMAEQMKEEFDGKMNSVQTQHEKEMEKLKVGSRLHRQYFKIKAIHH